MSNLDQAQPDVKIELGGVLRRVRFGLYALSQLERLLGKNPITDKVNINQLTVQLGFLWAGLIESWPDIDGDFENGIPDEKAKAGIKQVTGLVSPARFKEVMEAVGKAYANAIGEFVGTDSKKTGSSDEKKD